MKFVLITKDPRLADAAHDGLTTANEVVIHEDWQAALPDCEGAALLFVDLVATLDEPHKIAGYETFGQAKMEHPIAATTPVVLLSPEPDYDLDFMVGWEGFLYASVQRPVDASVFQRALRWV